jgi:hypothetical protein
MNLTGAQPLMTQAAPRPSSVKGTQFVASGATDLFNARSRLGVKVMQLNPVLKQKRYNEKELVRDERDAVAGSG